MKNVSSEFLSKMNSDNRDFLYYVDITLADGTVLPQVDNSKIWENGVSFEDASSGSDSFSIGTVIAQKCKITLSNMYDAFSAYDFDGAKVVVWLGMSLADDRLERIKMGTYTVTDPSYDGTTITLECLDNIMKFSKKFESSLPYPTTLEQIVRDACQVCQVNADAINLQNGTFTVSEKPEGDNLTFADILSYVGQISCQFATCDADGRLRFKWYDGASNTDVSWDGGTFVWSDGDNLDGGVFWNGGNIVDAGDFDTWIGAVSNFTSLSVSTDDVIITGVKVIEGTDDEAETLEGNEGYVIEISDNPLIESGKGSSVASYVGSKLIGLTFRPFSGSVLADPTVECGDYIKFVDRKGNVYNSIINEWSYKAGNTTKIACNAMSAARNSIRQLSDVTKAYLKAKAEIEKEKTEREFAIEQLNQSLSEGGGLYSWTESDGNGGTIYYFCNQKKEDASTSKVLAKVTATAIGLSYDGGRTYNYGFQTDTATAILQSIYTHGINADYINTGTLTALSINNGNGTFHVTPQGKVTASDLHITGGGIDVSSTLSNAQVLRLLYSTGTLGQTVYNQRLIKASAGGWDALTRTVNSGQTVDSRQYVNVYGTGISGGTWTGDIDNPTKTQTWILDTATMTPKTVSTFVELGHAGSSDGNFNIYGHLVAERSVNKIWRCSYNGLITNNPTQSSATSNFTWGLSIEKIKTALGANGTLDYVGGSWQVIGTNGEHVGIGSSNTREDGMMGYGTGFKANTYSSSVHVLTPGRYHTAPAGDFGTWALSSPIATVGNRWICNIVFKEA